MSVHQEDMISSLLGGFASHSEGRLYRVAGVTDYDDGLRTPLKVRTKDRIE